MENNNLNQGSQVDQNGGSNDSLFTVENNEATTPLGDTQAKSHQQIPDPVISPAQSEQIELSENPQPQGKNIDTVANTPTPEVTQPVIEPEQKKKKSKLPIILGIVVLIIILAFVGVYLYIKNTYTAEEFLTNNYNNITTFMSNNLSSSFNIDSSILNQDIITSGTISIDNYNLEYDINLALDSDYAKINLDYLDNSTSLLSGSIYLKKNLMYIKSSDIYEYPLVYDLEENYFDYIDISSLDDYDIDYVSAINNLIKYLYEAIDASDKTSQIDGTTVIYTYSINENNLSSINNTFINSIESDEDLSKLLDLLEIESDELSLGETEVNITQDIISGEITDFNINDLIGTKTNDGEYTLTSSDELENAYFVVNYTDNTFGIVYYEEDIETFRIYVKYDDTTANLYVSSEDTAISLYETNIDDDTINVTISVTQGEEVVSLNANITTVSDSEFNIDGSIDINTEDYNYTIDFTNTTQFGENLVLVENINNGVDINNISDEEAYIIYYNLMVLYEKLGLSSYSLSM